MAGPALHDDVEGVLIDLRLILGEKDDSLHDISLERKKGLKRVAINWPHIRQL